MRHRKLSARAAFFFLGACGVTALAALVIWTRNSVRSSTSQVPPQTPSASSSGPIANGIVDPAQLTALADGGLSIAKQLTGPVANPESLKELREAILARGRGLGGLQEEFDQLRLDARSSAGQVIDACRLQLQVGALLLFDGRFDEAAAVFQNVLALGESSGMPSVWRKELTAVLGIIALRRGEVDNCIACLGPSSCIFPIAPEAVHTNTAGSREAIEHFTAYLEEAPDDLRIRWLLNIAYMTLGEYPQRVPPQYVIPLGTFQSNLDVGRFHNVAPLVGLTSRSPNLAGGSVFDDFTGDGLPDLFTTATEADYGASLYVNRGDGTFEYRSESVGLADQVYALNVTRADYDNDGDLDVLLLRGAWEDPMRLSLLRNNGKGVFEDVTVAAGMAALIASESAAWGDYDNDGFADVFVCGEYSPPFGSVQTAAPDTRNRCRLYRNRGDGTFVDVAAAAGVLNERWAKGSAWGDYDGDGWLDLFVSNMSGICRLYRNQKDGKFRDVGPELGVTGPDRSFACWFWDYDNDGRLDLYVNDYLIRVEDSVAIALGQAPQRSSRPRLYRNLGPEGFREMTIEVGLDRGWAPMGCNFGDIDNDGYLDMYLGTGRMSLDSLMPNVMFKNVAGQRFEDITLSSGTGHLQKGHGVSFADWDCDGDLDFFVEVGGAVPGDKAYNLLFQNPGHGRHWLKIKLVGTKSNRAALGAQIKAVVTDRDGAPRSIYRTVGGNSSFGGNSLVELIGLREATSVSELEISWPTSRTTQTFRDIAADQLVVITEGAAAFQSVSQPRLPPPRPDKVPAK